LSEAKIVHSNFRSDMHDTKENIESNMLCAEICFMVASGVKRRLRRICRSKAGGIIDLCHLMDSQIHTDHFQRLLVGDSPSSNPCPPFEGQEAGAVVLREVRVALEASWW
jgi:hypothetical protein